MSEHTLSRRRFVQASGLTVAVAVLPGTAAASGGGWQRVATPVDTTVHDVVYTKTGAYAVCGGGIVMARKSEGWQKVVDGGPTGNGNDLYGAGVTDDGERFWVVGASGAIGEYDVTTGNLNDHSTPMDVTNNFNDVAVTGEAGEATVEVAGDSGKCYYSFENGATGTWDYVTPGSGSAINAIDCDADRKGHIVDGNQSVFETADGSTWSKTGIADANVNLYGVDAQRASARQTESDDVDSDGSDDVWVSGGGGQVFHWNGARWIPTDTGDAGLRDIEVADGRGYTVGGGGKVYAYDGREWTQQATPSGANLKAVALGEVDIAVGAAGTVLER